MFLVEMAPGELPQGICTGRSASGNCATEKNVPGNRPFRPTTGAPYPRANARLKEEAASIMNGPLP